MKRLKARLRRVFESIIYAGMTPGARAPHPLYLSNRTWGQKLRLAAWLAIPICAAGIALAMALSGHFDRARLSRAAAEPADAQIAGRVAPGLPRDIEIEPAGLEVVSVHIEQGAAAKLTGAVRNNRGHAIENAEVDFVLMDLAGVALTTVTARIPHIDAAGSATFATPIRHKAARYAQVQEIRAGR